MTAKCGVRALRCACCAPKTNNHTLTRGGEQTAAPSSSPAPHLRTHLSPMGGDAEPFFCEAASPQAAPQDNLTESGGRQRRQLTRNPSTRFSAQNMGRYPVLSHRQTPHRSLNGALRLHRQYEPGLWKNKVASRKNKVGPCCVKVRPCFSKVPPYLAKGCRLAPAATSCPCMPHATTPARFLPIGKNA